MYPIEMSTNIAQMCVGWVTKFDWCSCVTSCYKTFPAYFQDNNIDYLHFSAIHLDDKHVIWHLYWFTYRARLLWKNFSFLTNLNIFAYIFKKSIKLSTDLTPSIDVLYCLCILFLCVNIYLQIQETNKSLKMYPIWTLNLHKLVILPCKSI